MSFDLDEDILQDFLIEAGEILELLSEQLVELERSPDDSELLNAIFRGFHTVKGGAGFLSLTELVEACHGAENIFDLLRTGKRSVTSELMDVILEALDTINVMFGQVQEREPVVPAEPSLLDALHRFSLPPSEQELAMANPVQMSAPEVVVEVAIESAMAASSMKPVAAPISEPVAASPSDVAIAGDSVDDITQDEFDRLLDELHGKGRGPSDAGTGQEMAPASFSPVADTDIVNQIQSENGDITDDEFERLLDELHGAGKGPGSNDFSSPVANEPVSQAPASRPAANQGPVSAAQGDSGNDDLMSDDEFERLLDELHGVGKGPSEDELEMATKSVADMLGDDIVQAQTQAPAQVQAQPEPTPAVQPVAERRAKPAPGKEKSKAGEATVRVDTSTLDTIMNMVGELVLVRNRLVSLGLNTNDEDMSKAVANLDVVTADLQGAVMKTRMQPIKKVFGRFPRVVRDLARNLNKDIVLETRGEETDLDKNLVEALADPLVHLVRNSVDHGIEMPAIREKAGKPRVGTVLLSASQEGDHILLTIEDDGGGMDPDKLRGIAVERGVMDADAASRLTDTECYNLIFAPGFSTKKEISDISGRGVGMDVVKTGISQLNGSISIDSALGKGTRIDIKVPLTLAILPTLMVGVAEQPFALPLASVNEIFHLDLRKTNTVDGQLTIIVRDKAIPLFYLQDWLSGVGVPRREREHGHVVIVQIGHQRIGFVVDTLIGQEEVVIKPLDELLQGTPGMAGATITSDGHIALILDVPNLLKHYASR
ncbi:chemotaxis protein CheA [Photobacterium lutimaris]|uniref:Chemotaxis protein CheA n=1 Tax=Photobacterium lutimaris TaxID=388278 RepID=A0A2T3INE1_9GAMM|nr:chemotaxis protein CheA [Photobacterium lutimaris]PSU29873.1 chemotaxis protein CheA [Photobacterium lutimaris]TDR75298.1 two-component system chemotaxis sensor kinase CheA [Photobacterium lutimaris]